jgi:hypothetical protein
MSALANDLGLAARDNASADWIVTARSFSSNAVGDRNRIFLN